MFPGLLPVAGSALGAAAAMYLFDPDRGRRRRALMRDQLLSAASHLDDAIEATARDLIHRAQGLLAEARSTVSDEEVSDEVLVNRVRTKMGRVVSHPRAIKVTLEQGRVTLSGAVLEHEHEDLLQAVRSVQGVVAVADQLEPAETYPYGV
ncbi:MAG: BON domain-containing protein [Gammaproteobacteria bacterium]